MFFALLVATTLASQVLAQSVCPPDGWHHYAAGNKCIKYVHEKTTFDRARISCQMVGGDLIQVQDHAEAVFAYGLSPDGGWVFIGIYDHNHDRNFKYVDGSHLTPYAAGRWAHGEPNNSGGNEYCVNMWDKNNPHFNDIACGAHQSYICEINLATSQEPSKCNPGWTYYAPDNTCLLASTSGQNFGTARHVCSFGHADLVKITDRAKSDVVYDLVAINADIWFGLWDQHHNQQFRYVDGSDMTAYRPWNSGEPNNFFNSEQCVHLINKVHTGLFGRWNDGNCGAQIFYVCEAQANELPTTTTTTTTTTPTTTTTTAMAPAVKGCDTDWAHNADAGVCIKAFSDVKASFDGARDHCREEGGDLVTALNSRQQNDFVRSLLNNKLSYWIGIVDETGDEIYKYVDGSDLTYTSFKRGEPNNKRGNEHCVAMKKSKWSDKKCNKKNNFVCQKSDS